MRIRKALRGLAVLSFVAALLWASSALASSQATVSGIRHHSAQGHTRVVIDLTASAKFEHRLLRNPDRLFVDFQVSGLDDSVERAMTIQDGLLRQVRSAQHGEDTVRIVLDLDGFKEYKVYSLERPSRVVIDIYGTAAAKPAREIKTLRIVLDPGHGGKDPGAMGPGGIMEKDIVLDIARRVKSFLERETDFEVLLTRSSDVYLTLEERTLMANKSKADLFVSIHLNANAKRSARGLETYLLNWTDNQEAIKVAARENMISVRRMQEARSELGVILASLQLQNKRDESLKLAHFVQEGMVSSLRSRYQGVDDLGVKQALFYVLVGAEMPSVLVEGSFITNRMEARRLRTGAYRDRVARGVVDGIKTYFQKTEPYQEVAQR